VGGYADANDVELMKDQSRRKVCVYVCVYVCMYVYMYVCVCMYVCM
jgi:hypothetical protein